MNFSRRPSSTTGALRRALNRTLGLKRPAATVAAPTLQRSNAPTLPRPQAPAIQRFNESAVALVVTLILLAVITFMAVTFLVVTNSERGTVSVQTEDTIAREHLEIGIAHANSEIIA